MYIGFDDLFYTFFEFRSGKHDLMSAAKAFYPEVGACAHNFPLLASARMFLSEFNDVSEAIFIGHGNTPFIISGTLILYLL